MWKIFLRRIRTATVRPYKRDLVVERLEDREVPAVITVTSLLDSVATDGQVTLREAIQSANNDKNINNDLIGRVSGTYGADTIVFAAALGGGTINVIQNDTNFAFGPTAYVVGSTNRQVTNLDLVIDGQTGANTGITIDGKGLRRLFAVADGASLTLNHLTLQNGLALGGNGGNSASAGGGGGAMGAGGAVYAQGTLTVLNSTFVGNVARGGNGGAGGDNTQLNGGGGGGGGAFGFSGGSGAAEGGGGGGGGVRGAGNNGTISVGGLGGANQDNNRAAEEEDGTFGGGGGGGSVDNNIGNGGDGLDLSDASIGGGGGGGGTLGINEGPTNSGGFGGYGAGGGGAGVDPDIEGFSIIGDSGDGGFGAGGGGGAGSASDFSSGGAGGFGAGNGGDGVSGELAQGGGGGGGLGAGGAIFIDGGTVVITNSTFNGNTAQGGNGGARGGTRGQSLGGAIFNLNGDLTITNATLSGNDAADAGRQVYVAGGFFDEGQNPGFNIGSAVTLIRNSILGQNNNAITDFFQTTFNSGTVSSSGTNNLIRRNATGANAFGGTFSTADPLLLALANNGGPTRTMALQQTSPAIDAATFLVSLDQRGVTRPQRTANDIGSFELPPAVSPTTPTSLVIFPSATDVCVGDRFNLVVQARTSTGINTTVNGPVIARILVGPPGSILLQNGYNTLGVAGTFTNGVATFNGLGLSTPGTYLLQTFTPSGLSMTVTITVTDITGRRRGAR